MIQSLDARILLAIYGGAHGAWAAPMLAATILGEGWTAALLLPLLLWVRTRRFASYLTGAVVAQALLVKLLKVLVGRVRPWIVLGLPQPFMNPHDPSFPSGHAAGCFCVLGFLVTALPVAWPHAPGRRRAAVAAAAAAAALIALSRVYLAAHFPSDVLVGALLGGLVGGLAGQRYAAPRAGVERAPKKG